MRTKIYALLCAIVLAMFFFGQASANGTQPPPDKTKTPKPTKTVEPTPEPTDTVEPTPENTPEPEPTIAVDPGGFVETPVGTEPPIIEIDPNDFITPGFTPENKFKDAKLPKGGYGPPLDASLQARFDGMGWALWVGAILCSIVVLAWALTRNTRKQ